MTIEPFPGTSLSRACKQASIIALTFDEEVLLMFNDIPVLVRVGELPAAVEEQYKRLRTVHPVDS